MQEDGNLVEYSGGGHALWHTATAGNPGARAVMQTDGNFVVYAKSGLPIWNSQTAGSGPARLVLQDDANLVVYNGGGATWSAGTNPSVLRRGDFLRAGWSILSTSRQYRLVMQGDGNLVIYQEGRAIWSSNTTGQGGVRAVFQGDQNFVIYDAADRPVWNTQTTGSGADRLIIQEDANLVLYRSDGHPAWSAGSSNPLIRRGENLRPGWSLFSPDRRFRFIMQGDGNLVLYQGSQPLWHIGTAGQPGATAVLQHDQNFVVYRGSTPLWNAATTGSGADFLQVQSDGNAVMYRNSGQPVWHTGTAGGAGGTPAVRPSGDDYPADCSDRVAGENCRTAPLDAYVDRWGFYSRECTSFVAWRMNRDHGAGSFHNSMRGGRFGNAGDWDDNARRLGYAVSATPRVGAIAHWGHGEMGSVGHVGYVSEVLTDGRVVIEDYNRVARGTYAKSAPMRAPRYIYFP